MSEVKYPPTAIDYYPVVQTILLAIGGNSLITDSQHATVPDQYAAVVQTVGHIADLVTDHRVVVTHGNGPQVGFILLRSEHSRGILHPVPLDSIVADTQGALGYQIQQALQNELHHRGLKKSVTTVITQTLVDRDDPAFQKPTKPIGAFYTRVQAEDRMRVEKWIMIEDAGRGWRRVVASPKPKRIIEADVIKHLVRAGYVTIAAGGGGIPVIEEKSGKLTGAPAVIDKDLASAVLAAEIQADTLVISTAVPKVCIHFGKPGQTALDEITIEEAQHYIAEGHFAAGSMLPKIQACIAFLQCGGSEAIITNPESLSLAIKGNAGTRILRS